MDNLGTDIYPGFCLYYTRVKFEFSSGATAPNISKIYMVIEYFSILNCQGLNKTDHCAKESYISEIFASG